MLSSYFYRENYVQIVSSFHTSVASQQVGFAAATILGWNG